jgi:hypothetical protein
MLLVDTNVLLDVLENDPAWAEWSLRQLRAQAQTHGFAINPIIYAELSLAFDSVPALDAAIAGMGLDFEELPRPALSQLFPGGAAGDALAPKSHSVSKWPVSSTLPRRAPALSSARLCGTNNLEME